MIKYILTIALLLFKIFCFGSDLNANSYGEKRSNFTIIAQMECANNATIIEEFQLRGKSTKTFNNEAYTGCIIKRYDSGKIHITGQYTNGKKSGNWITYWEDGAIKATKNYSTSS